MSIKPILQSKTVWGVGMSVIAPLATQAAGIDVTTGFNLLHNIQSGFHEHYSVMQWLQIAAQVIGYALTVAGTVSKNRTPLTTKPPF